MALDVIPDEIGRSRHHLGRTGGILTQTEPYHQPGILIPWWVTKVRKAAISPLGSDQDEIDQSAQRGRHAADDQGVVGTEVGLRIERGWVGFFGHFGRLGRGDPDVCEAGHIRGILFTTCSSGTA